MCDYIIKSSVRWR